MKRFPALLVLALVLTPAAAAKGNVLARLDTPLPRSAAAGTKLALRFSLTTPDGPFDAQAAVVVNLRGDDDSARAYASEPSRGRYVAQVSVPAGGVRDIEIGLEGRMCDIAGCRPSDMLFPITNDPFPGAEPAETGGGGGSALTWAVGGALAFLGLAALCVPLLRRRTLPLRA